MFTDMICLQWLMLSIFLIYCKTQVVFGVPEFNNFLGDIEGEDGAIDRAKLLLKSARGYNGLVRDSRINDDISSLEKALVTGEKINFAVTADDPRYELSSKELNVGLPNRSDLKGSDFLPSINNNGPNDSIQKNFPLPPNQTKDAVNFLLHNKQQAQVPASYISKQSNVEFMPDFYFVVLIAGCTAAAVCAVVGAGICYFRLNRSKRDAADAEYPAYGVTGPCKDFSPSAADRKLAQSAHMFHYQHQKQQMLALGKNTGDERHCSASDVDSDEEGEEGDYTVYECPGLAPTGEMEVKNPLFSDDPTPASPAPPAKESNGNRKTDDRNGHIH